MTEPLDTLAKFGDEFQKKCVVALLNDRSFVEQSLDILDPKFFESDANRWTVDRIAWYFAEYKSLPSIVVLKKEADKIPEGQKALQLSVVENLKDLFHLNKEAADDLKYVKDELLQFCRNQAMKQAVLKSVDHLKNGNYELIKLAFDKALNAGAERNLGHIWLDDFDKRVSKTARNVISTPWEAINEIMDGGLGAGELGVIVAPSGCHAKGTRLLLSTGKEILVENVKIGDRLLGTNGEYRTVLKLVTGRQNMFKIIPVKGEPFVVNADHILSLRRGRDKKVVNISVKEYLGQSNNFKNEFKLYRSDCVHFEKESHTKLPIPPYMLGVLLGDGCLHSKNLSVTTMDAEIANEVFAFSNDNGCSVTTFSKIGTDAKSYSLAYKKGKTNPIASILRRMELFDIKSMSKFIPHEYKTTDVSGRLELLAGLIDTDGHLSGGTYDICLRSERLLDDIIFIARSLGLAAYKSVKFTNGVAYYRTCISGNISQIPCKIPRKRATRRQQIKDVLHTGFQVIPVGEDEFFGFVVDGNHLYLGADYTVHHNCGKSWLLSALGQHALKLEKTVVHYTFELADTYTGLRYDTITTGIEPNAIKHHTALVKQKIAEIPGQLIIKHFPTRTVNVQGLRAHIERLKSHGINIDLAILDYADLMRSMEHSNARHEELGYIYEEIRGLFGELGIPCWTASQSQRSSLQDDVVEMDKIAGAYAKVMVADFIMSASRKVGDKITNTARIHVPKNRFGPDGLTFPAEMDLAHGKIGIYDENSPEGMLIKQKLNSGEGVLKSMMAKKFLDLSKKKEAEPTTYYLTPQE